MGWSARVKFAQSVQILTHLGPRWVFFRAGYAWRRRTGGLERRTAVGSWPRPVDPGSDPRPGRAVLRAAAVDPGCVSEAEGVLRGCYPYFSHHRVEAGRRPDWGRSPWSGVAAPMDKHWSRLGDSAHGDIKLIWELSRFAWVFPLVRAHARTGEERYVAGFWELFEHWLQGNPPNQGPNWMCGQEAAIRLFAAVFARDSFAGSVESTPAREGAFRNFVQATGERIFGNLDYALSQSNNHGVSECVGLLTASRWVRDSRVAARWRARALSALRDQLSVLVYSDGGFAQHSAIYHRVLLHDLVWAVSEFRRYGEGPPEWLEDAARRALGFLDGLMTESTGRVPLYGANDGANLLPLSDSEYLDFRPVVQSASVVLNGVRRLPEGPWDEAAGWLSGRDEFRPMAGAGGLGMERVPGPDWHIRSDGGRVWHATEAGCLVWWSGGTRLFLRCPTRFRHRPSQADLLHVDVEWRGQQIAQDAGTYSYEEGDMLGAGFKSAACHNTVTVDGFEPMRKAGRFLYLPWPRGSAGWEESGRTFQASHDGYGGLGVSHVRSVRCPRPESFLVEDRVSGSGIHRVRLHWLLADLPTEIELHSRRLVLGSGSQRYAIRWEAPKDAQASLVRAEPGTARGWWSPHYRHAMPAQSLEILVTFSGTVTLRTWFEPL